MELLSTSAQEQLISEARHSVCYEQGSPERNANEHGRAVGYTKHSDQHGVDIILITVCSSGAQVSPGMTDTDIISDSLPSFDLNQIPMGRVGTPAEIADVVFYLLSDGASYVSGANVRVAGGRAPGLFNLHRLLVVLFVIHCGRKPYWVTLSKHIQLDPHGLNANVK